MAKRLIKQDQQSAAALEAALTLVAEGAFHPSLITHKLQGELNGSWAATAGYDLRIVPQIVIHEGQKAILLETIGTHDDVYQDLAHRTGR